ncbi:MAG: hypothetical protein D3923_14010 [Candidatus Electrothrix sp. AR3]|nr:hypothetical protein [Candidatus Electrothrix sp. AR3]
MKKNKGILLAAALTTFYAFSPVQAKFDIPDHVYRLSQLNEVQEAAKKSGKPITFVYSNKETSCSMATAASKDILQELKDYSPIIYVEQDDIKKFPAALDKAFRAKESGEYIPKTVVLNADVDTMVCILPYAAAPLRGKLIQQVQEIISAHTQAEL